VQEIIVAPQESATVPGRKVLLRGGEKPGKL